MPALCGLSPQDGTSTSTLAIRQARIRERLDGRTFGILIGLVPLQVGKAGFGRVGVGLADDGGDLRFLLRLVTATPPVDVRPSRRNSARTGLSRSTVVQAEIRPSRGVDTGGAAGTGADRRKPEARR
jgi:hypothetical protein